MLCMYVCMYVCIHVWYVLGVVKIMKIVILVQYVMYVCMYVYTRPRCVQDDHDSNPSAICYVCIHVYMYGMC